jgi:leucyl-tRNA synthetase
MRIGLADAGDGVEDANFETSMADNAVLRLYTQLKWVEEVLANKDKLVKGPPNRFADLVFDSQINRAITLTDAAYAK